MRLLCLIVTLLMPAHACAGAWMRDVGTTFLSFGTTVQETGQLDGSIYAEHGVRPKLTLGLKIDAEMTNGQMGDGTAIVFLRKPIATDTRAFKLAYEFGLGSTFGDQTTPLLRGGLSFGRGITVWEKSGWAAMDAAVEWDVETNVATYKLDGTIGLNLSDRFQIMMQVFLSQSDSDSATTLAPSLVWRPKVDGPARYQLGVESASGVIALKLGLWRTF